MSRLVGLGGLDDSLPWDNEPTPMADAASFIATVRDEIKTAVPHYVARDLERRLRHAEKLLERLVNQSDEDIYDDAMKHLAAAREEDAKPHRGEASGEGDCSQLRGDA